MDPAPPVSEPLAVAPDARAALAVNLRRLRHDLGKSLSLQLRFAGTSASEAERAAALREDVCRTRRGPAGIISAFELFDAAWRWLSGAEDLPDAVGRRVDLSGDEVVQALRMAIEDLRAARDVIESASLRGEPLDVLVARAELGTRCCRDLVRRYPGDRDG